MASTKSEIQAKTERLEAVRQRVQQFVDNGGDLKSSEATPVGLELIEAYADLAKEFGYEILKPIKKKGTL